MTILCNIFWNCSYKVMQGHRRRMPIEKPHWISCWWLVVIVTPFHSILQIHWLKGWKSLTASTLYCHFMRSLRNAGWHRTPVKTKGSACVQAFVRPCMHPESLLTQYLAEYLTHFHQTYINGALWDRYECFTIWGQMVIGQGHGRINNVCWKQHFLDLLTRCLEKC